MYKFLIIFLFSTNVIAHPIGAINPNVTQDNINTTICVPGYTKTIRPPVSYTNALEKKQIKELKYSDTNQTHTEEDHFVNLGIGGSPSDPNNLWPQPYSGKCNARDKDQIEVKLQRLVCKKSITLKEAQDAIMSDWVQAYNKYIQPKTPLTCK